MQIELQKNLKRLLMFHCLAVQLSDAVHVVFNEETIIFDQILISIRLRN